MPAPQRSRLHPLGRRLRVEPLEDRRMLATLTVDTTLDVVDESDGVLSLREAIAAAQDGDTVTFAPELAGETITLADRPKTSNFLLITSNIVIDGDILDDDRAADITISGGGHTRIFFFSAFVDVSVRFQSLNLVNARGGAILVNGSDKLELFDSTITGSTTSDRGGAITNLGDLTLRNVVLSGNTADRGGAVYNHGQALSIENTTFANNAAMSGGGAVYQRQQSSSDESQIINATFVGNTAGTSGGAIYSRGGSSYLKILHSTITGNVANERGGGVYVTRTPSFTNSIVAGNNAGGLGADVAASRLYESSFRGVNIFSEPPRAFQGFTPGQTGETSILASPEELFAETTTLGLPMAVPSGVLADNGGPVPTVALLDAPSNPALNAVEINLAAVLDARGADRGISILRRLGGLADVGAYEAEPTTPLNPTATVTTPSDAGEDATVTGDLAAEAADGDGLSLREAVVLANATPGPDKIDFDFGIDGPVTIALAAGELAITDPLLIEGGGKDLLTIDARGQSRIFRIDETIVSIAGVTLTNGYAEGDGGAIRSTGDLLLVDSVVSGNTAERSGGGVSTRFGRLQVVTSTIRDNRSLALPIFSSAPYDKLPQQGSLFLGGGGVYAVASDVAITGSLIADNHVSRGEGGGIRQRYRGSLRLTNSTVSGNFSDRHGGGVSIADGVDDLIVQNSTITRNVGGTAALFTFGVENIEVTNSIIVENQFNPEAGHFSDGNANNFKVPLDAIRSSLVGLPGGQETVFVGSANPYGDSDTVPAPGIHLGELVDNGGPTLTHRLLPFSIGVDAGDAALLPADYLDLDGDGDRQEALPVDQRGPSFARVANAGLDIGALEIQPDLASLLTLVVSTLDDESDGDFSPGEVSLREAIALAQSDLFPGHDEITFADGLSGVMTLEHGALGIDESLTITGPGRDVITIDADRKSRAFDIAPSERSYNPDPIDFVIAGLTVRNGVASDDRRLFDFDDPGFSSGGAVRFVSEGSLTINDSRISGSRALRNEAYNGLSDGGGVFAASSRFSEPVYLNLNNTIVSDNHSDGNGGGVAAENAEVTIDHSTVASNDSSSTGGGVYVGSSLSPAEVLISNSTISGNTADYLGAGVRVDGHAVIQHSTISDNYSERRSYFPDESSGIAGNATISDSIVARNRIGEEPSDIGFGVFTLDHSIVGVARDSVRVIEPIPGSNLIGTTEAPIDPLLGPLADHGGPTPTHALLPGSPALDAGDPAVVFDPLVFDQRGEGFARVAEGDGVGPARIDIGAYESQGVPVAFPVGDFNRDGVADVADFTVWRDTLGRTVAAGTGADADSDGEVTIDDYRAWRDAFGATTPVLATPPAALSLTTPTTDRLVAILVDAAKPASLTDDAFDAFQPDPAPLVAGDDVLLLAIDRAPGPSGERIDTDPVPPGEDRDPPAPSDAFAFDGLRL